MRIEEFLENNILTIRIFGDLDASSAILLDDAMKKALKDKNHKIIIDCQELDYISSAGIGVFISYLEEFKEINGRFVFYNMNEKVLNTFKILGLDKLMSFYSSEKEAKDLVNES